MNNQKKIEAIWGVLCTSSSIDQDTNNISLYKVIERLALTKREGVTPEGNHTIPLQHEYIIFFQRPDPINEKETFPLSIRVKDPSGVILNEASIPAVFEKGMKRLRIRMQNNALTLNTAGEYRFEVLFEGSETPCISTPLEVIVN